LVTFYTKWVPDPTHSLWPCALADHTPGPVPWSGLRVCVCIYIYIYIYIYIHIYINKVFTGIFLKENFTLFNNHNNHCSGKNK